MLTEAELAAIRARDAEVIPVVRREVTPNVWTDRHRLLETADALSAALAAERRMSNDLAADLAAAQDWYPGREVFPGWPESLGRWRVARQEVKGG